MYEALIKYAGILQNRELTVELGGGTQGLDDFIRDFYDLDGFADTSYFDTLERYGVDDARGIEGCDVEHADADLVRACITWRVRGDRFCDGCLKACVESGFIDRCLARLKALNDDDEFHGR